MTQHHGLLGLYRYVRARPIERIRIRIRAMAQAVRAGNRGRATRLSHRLQAQGMFLSPKADLSPDVTFPHPTGIVIGEGCVVENGVTLYQSVTLGGARRGDWKAGNYPTIGANTVVFAGAKVLGAVRVGRNCTIGANAVVLSDIPDGATAVGTPARVVHCPDTSTRPLPADLPRRAALLVATMTGPKQDVA